MDEYLFKGLGDESLKMIGQTLYFAALSNATM